MSSVSTAAQKPLPDCPSAGLVLVAPGGVDPAVARRLAALLELRLLQPVADQWADPIRLLGDLAREPQGWLLPLALDPGALLPAAGCWAESLAAWRQPAVLLVPAARVGTGADRAYAALLEAEAVPLLGLVQLGGPWQPASRRRDCLAWLGWLPAAAGGAGSEDELAEQQLRRLLRARWSLSSARVAEPGCPPA